MSGDFPSLASVFYPSHCVPTILMLKDKPFVHLLWSLNSLPTSSGSNSRATIPTPEENWQLWLFWDKFSRVILIGRDVCLTYWLEFNHFLTHTQTHRETGTETHTYALTLICKNQNTLGLSALVFIMHLLSSFPKHSQETLHSWKQLGAEA